MDRYDLYEFCVQSPRHITGFLRALSGPDAAPPLILREDFCATAAIARRWAAEGAKRGDRSRAIAVDIDPDVLARAHRDAAAADPPIADRIRFIQSDIIADAVAHDPSGPSHPAAAAPPDDDPDNPDDPADAIFVGNFSIGEIHRRADLLAYLRRSHERLSRGNAGRGGGVFVCDTYGGSRAFTLGGHQRTHIGRRDEVVRYTWEHLAADPTTGMVENTISFRLERGGEVIAEFPRAFTYRWRLWSIHELREAMHEAGFATTEVYKNIAVAPDERPEPARDPKELGEDWIVCVVGRC